MDKSKIRQYIERQKNLRKLSHRSVSGKTLRLSNESFRVHNKPLSACSIRSKDTNTINEELEGLIDVSGFAAKLRSESRKVSKAPIKLFSNRILTLFDEMKIWWYNPRFSFRRMVEDVESRLNYKTFINAINGVMESQGILLQKSIAI